MKARMNNREWQEIQRVLAGGSGDCGILGSLAPFGLWSNGALTAEAVSLFKGFAERTGRVTVHRRNRFETEACQAWFGQSRAGTIMIDDGEGLIFQECSPGAFPMLLLPFLRIGPLPLAKADVVAVKSRPVTSLLADAEVEGEDEKLADSLREAAPDVSRAVIDGDWLLWSVAVTELRESSPRTSDALVVLVTPGGFLGFLPHASDPDALIAMPLRSATIWEALTQMIAPAC